VTDVATIVRGFVPSTEFALGATLDRLPEAAFETERVVTSGEDAVMPLLWVRQVEREEADRALEADPTVEEVSSLADFGTEHLYRMKWVDHVDLLLQMLTNSEATVLDAYGRGDQWGLRVLYPSREEFSMTHEFCNDHGLTFEAESIREMDGEPAGRFGLTEEQYQALVAATEQGYYGVPRGSKLQEIAGEFDLSHQAFSERLRRGTASLVRDTLIVGEPPGELRSP
jgi:predicted DNA binding protein